MNIQAYLHTNGGCCVYYPSNIFHNKWVLKIGEYYSGSPQPYCGNLFSHVTHLDQWHASENIWWIMCQDNVGLWCEYCQWSYLRFYSVHTKKPGIKPWQPGQTNQYSVITRCHKFIQLLSFCLYSYKRWETKIQHTLVNQDFNHNQKFQVKQICNRWL